MIHLYIRATVEIQFISDVSHRFRRVNYPLIRQMIGLVVLRFVKHESFGKIFDFDNDADKLYRTH